MNKMSRFTEGHAAKKLKKSSNFMKRHLMKI